MSHCIIDDIEIESRSGECKEVCEISVRKLKIKSEICSTQNRGGIVIQRERGRERQIGNEGRCRRVGYIH